MSAVLQLSNADAARGLVRKLNGQDAALQAESTEWRTRALALLNIYVKGLRPGGLFAFEDFRAFSKACDLPEPHNHFVWGAFPSAARAAGVPIKMTERTRPARSPRTNGHRINIWEVVG